MKRGTSGGTRSAPCGPSGSLRSGNPTPTYPPSEASAIGGSMRGARANLVASAIGKIAVAASAFCVVTGLTSVSADTYTDRYGLTWTYTVTSGTDVTLTAVNDKEAIFSASNIPWTFTSSSVDYTVTAIGASLCSGWTLLEGKLTIPSAVKTMGSEAFNGCKGLTGVTIEEGLVSLPYTRTFYACEKLSGPLILPHSIEYIGRQTFLWTGELFTSLWVKGPLAVASGEQPYTTIDYYSGNVMYPHDKLGLKVALFGPYTKPDDRPTSNKILTALDGCIVYLPNNGCWLEEKLDSYFSGTMAVLYYGVGEELDLSIEETRNVLTATPTTANALTNVLKSVSVFKSDFGLDTRISVTNAIDLTGVTIAEDLAAAVTFDSLVFSVKTQTQLSSVLSAFPEAFPLTIDPTGLTETLVIPDGRNVFVKSGDGYEIKKIVSGLVVVFK